MNVNENNIENNKELSPVRKNKRGQVRNLNCNH